MTADELKGALDEVFTDGTGQNTPTDGLLAISASLDNLVKAQVEAAKIIAQAIDRASPMYGSR